MNKEKPFIPLWVENSVHTGGQNSLRLTTCTLFKRLGGVVKKKKTCHCTFAHKSTDSSRTDLIRSHMNNLKENKKTSGYCARILTTCSIAETLVGSVNYTYTYIAQTTATPISKTQKGKAKFLPTPKNAGFHWPGRFSLQLADHSYAFTHTHTQSEWSQRSRSSSEWTWWTDWCSHSHEYKKKTRVNEIY